MAGAVARGFGAGAENGCGTRGAGRGAAAELALAAARAAAAGHVAEASDAHRARHSDASAVVAVWSPRGAQVAAGATVQGVDVEVEAGYRRTVVAHRRRTPEASGPHRLAIDDHVAAAVDEEAQGYRERAGRRQMYPTWKRLPSATDRGQADLAHSMGHARGRCPAVFARQATMYSTPKPRATSALTVTATLPLGCWSTQPRTHPCLVAHAPAVPYTSASSRHHGGPPSESRNRIWICVPTRANGSP